MTSLFGRQVVRFVAGRSISNASKIAGLSAYSARESSSSLLKLNPSTNILQHATRMQSNMASLQALNGFQSSVRSLSIVGARALLLDPSNRQNEMIQRCHASNNMLVIRRKKMKKHKRRKRYKRDYFKYQKNHQQKKLKAETLFRQRMNAMIQELETFDPLEHVKDTMRRAKREWSVSLVPSGRKKYPHWSEMMSFEELYSLPPSDYIDKKSGRPTPEEQAKITELRRDYFKRYVRKSSSETPTKN
ncbi:hypothetical protein M3Y96_00706400 [Aphelenchoides besseyi]|nr:hypothetical protein M3Y96_00706400 [Aphelenchoides besseyi]